MRVAFCCARVYNICKKTSAVLPGQLTSNIGPYNVSKTALLGLTRNLAIELAPHIRVNCVAPGLIRTKFSAAVKSKALEVMRIRRLGDPSDCSGIVSFLCSAEASYITGETVAVAGGMLSHL
uniref:Dehydrogenase/reductase SDR family member 4 n=1 Tax=Laticauda laticaudata TaxID=8630 RepID=A0A8C5S2J0_LATLA